MPYATFEHHGCVAIVKEVSSLGDLGGVEVDSRQVSCFDSFLLSGVLIVYVIDKN